MPLAIILWLSQLPLMEESPPPPTGEVTMAEVVAKAALGWLELALQG